MNYCKYSFQDLINSACSTIDLTTLYNMSQVKRNETVKKLCTTAGWYFEDVMGSDGNIYTAFYKK